MVATEAAATPAAPEQPAAPAAALLVTADFGRTTSTDVAVSPGQSVLDALRSVSDVETTYGGRYVQAIDGREGSLERARDWLFFVNGLESPIGAAEVEVHDGDHVWWDYRRWRGYLHVPAVVGAWPEPFLHGSGGEKPLVQADPPLAAALEELGATLAPQAPDYRVVVGADAELREREPAWRRAAQHPRNEGLTVWLDGRRRAGVERPGGAGRDGAGRGGDRRGRAGDRGAAGGLRARGHRRRRRGSARRGRHHRPRSVRPPAPLRGGLRRRRAARRGRRQRGAPMRPPLPLLLLGGGLVAALFCTDHPAVLAGGVVAGLALLLAAPGPVRAPLGLGLLLAVPVALLNPFVAVEGDLVLVAGPSYAVLDLEVTLEELIYGAAVAGRLLAVTLLVVALLRLADADRLQARASRVAPRSALTVALAARLLPILRGDAAAIGEAARLRGVELRGRGVGVLLVPLAATSLERGLDQAEAMVARGYGAGRRTSLPERPLQLREWAAAALGAAVIPLAVALVAGLAPYAYYPRADGVLDAAGLLAGAALAATGIGGALLLRPEGRR